MPPGLVKASREPAVVAQATRQIPVDTTYVASAAADGRHKRIWRELAVRVTARAALLAAGAANKPRTELLLRACVGGNRAPSSVSKETSQPRTTAPRKDP